METAEEGKGKSHLAKLLAFYEYDRGKYLNGVLFLDLSEKKNEYDIVKKIVVTI